MSAILTSFQHPQPDCWEQIANFSLAPLRCALGVEYTVTNQTFQTLPMNSLIWRIFCGIVAVTVALPFTLIGTVSILLSSSHDKIWQLYNTSIAGGQSNNNVVSPEQQQEITDYFLANQAELRSQVNTIDITMPKPAWVDTLPHLWNGLQGTTLLRAVLIYIAFASPSDITKALKNCPDILIPLAQAYPSPDEASFRSAILMTILSLLNDDDATSIKLVTNFISNLSLLNDIELQTDLMEQITPVQWNLLLKHDVHFCATLMDSIEYENSYTVLKRCDLYVQQNLAVLQPLFTPGQQGSVNLDQIPKEDWMSALPIRFTELKEGGVVLGKAIFVYAFAYADRLPHHISKLSLAQIKSIALLDTSLYPQLVDIPFNFLFVDFLAGIFKNTAVDAAQQANKEQDIQINRNTAVLIAEFLNNLPAITPAIAQRLLNIFAADDWKWLVEEKTANAWLNGFVVECDKQTDLDTEQAARLQALKAALSL